MLDFGIEFVEETLKRTVYADSDAVTFRCGCRADADEHEHWFYIGFVCGCRVSVDPATGDVHFSNPWGRALCREHAARLRECAA